MKLTTLPRSRACAAALAAAFLLASTPNPTQAGTPVADTPPPPPPPDKFLQSFVTFYGTNYFNADFDGLDGFGLNVSRYSYYGEFKFRLSPVWMMKIFTYADYSLYNFDLPFPAPQFTDILRGGTFARVDATLAYTFAPGWAVVGGGRVSSGAATSANFSNSFTGGGILAIKKSIFNNGVDVTVGASYTSRLARPAQVFPYFDIDVNVLPSFVKLPINLQFKWGGGILSYRITESFSLMFEGRYDSRYYRLNSNPTPIYPFIGQPLQAGQGGGYPRSNPFANGVWYESGLDVGGGFGYTPRNKNWTFSVLGGAELFRNVQIYTNSGFKLLDRDVKPTPYLNANFYAAF